MHASLLLCTVALGTVSPTAAEDLEVGTTCTGDLRSDPEELAPTPELANHGVEAIVGHRHGLVVDATGTYTLVLHSYAFDAYLVVLGDGGVPVAEDDDGHLRTHARATAMLEAGTRYTVLACSLRGERGPYEIRLESGRPAPWTDEERERLVLADLERAVEVTSADRSLADAHFEATVDLAFARLDRGDTAIASAIAERLVKAESDAQEDGGLAAAHRWAMIAMLERGLGDPSASLAHYTLAHRLAVQTVGGDDPALVRFLHGRAIARADMGLDEEARADFEQALDLAERDPDTRRGTLGRIRSNLGQTCMKLADFEVAEEHLRVALELRRDAFGDESYAVADTLGDLSALANLTGDLSGALRLSERAHATLAALYGPDDLETADALRSVAIDLANLGRYDEARSAYERALAVFERRLGPEHPRLATLLHELGVEISDNGLPAEAIEYLERALAIRTTAFGPDHIDTLHTRYELGWALIWADGDADLWRIAERYLAALEADLGATHPDVARQCIDAAWCFLMVDEFERAAELARRAVAIQDSIGRPNPLRWADAHRALAFARKGLGRLEEALQSVRRVEQTSLEVYGPDSWRARRDAWNRLELMLDTGAGAEALPEWLTLEEAEVERVEAEVVRLAEWDVAAALDSVAARLGRIRHAVARHGDGAAERTLFELVVRWASVVDRARNEHVRRIVSDPGDSTRAVLEELRAVQAESTRAILAEARGRERTGSDRALELVRRRGELERRVLQSRPPTTPRPSARLTDLRSSLPPDSALIVFGYLREYRPPSEQAPGGELAAAVVDAWIVRPDRSGVERVPLAAAATIRERVERFLAALRESSDAEDEGAERRVRQTGVALREVLWDPLEHALGGVAHVVLCPDRDVGRVPFAALPLDDGRLLVEQVEIRFAPDPGWLARSERPAVVDGAGSAILAVGGVDYDARGASRPDSSATETRGGMLSLWQRLRHSGREASAVVELHRSVFGEDAPRLLLDGAHATELAIRERLESVRYAHFATHAYFEPEPAPNARHGSLASRGEIGEIVSGLRVASELLPGSLTGLVCSGANRSLPGTGDGALLTADEIAWLDLGRCELVVLSACETSLGVARSGLGQRSLRQAFLGAGAGGVVSTLWSVDDGATRALMERFYRRVFADEMRAAAALRAAQLETLADLRARRRGASVPFLWASFVVDA